ncbi:Pycsar system effector family protein [Nocardia testacea]|uniref:Pycsar system effector family protein n=1 Tax=Nocardia testacea TaxID=248551 RepID=A0ABW7VXA6_9NOCA
MANRHTAGRYRPKREVDGRTGEEDAVGKCRAAPPAPGCTRGDGEPGSGRHGICSGCVLWPRTSLRGSAPNLLYFGSIAGASNLTADTYRYRLVPLTPDPDELLAQVWTNVRIAHRKFRYANLAVLAILVAGVATRKHLCGVTMTFSGHRHPVGERGCGGLSRFALDLRSQFPLRSAWFIDGRAVTGFRERAGIPTPGH